MTQTRKKAKPKHVNTKVNTSYTISYTNIRGLQSNFPELQSHILQTKPDVLFVCETGHLNDLGSLRVDGYNDPTKKDDSRHGHGLAIYIKNDFPCSRASSYEDPSLPYMCFRVALLQSTAFIFTLYRPQTDGIAIFDSIAEKIDLILVLMRNLSTTF